MEQQVSLALILMAQVKYYNYYCWFFNMFVFKKKILKFSRVKAQVSSIERVPVKISWLNLGKHIQLQIILTRCVTNINLKFVLWTLETLVSFFKNENITNNISNIVFRPRQYKHSPRSSCGYNSWIWSFRRMYSHFRK